MRFDAQLSARRGLTNAKNGRIVNMDSGGDWPAGVMPAAFPNGYIGLGACAAEAENLIKWNQKGVKDVDDYPSSNAGNPRERQALCALSAASFRWL